MPESLREPERGNSPFRIDVEPLDIPHLRKVSSILFGHVEASARARQLNHLLQESAAAGERCGILVARDLDERTLGALAWYIQPGRTAIATPPGVVPPAGNRLITELLRRACREVERYHIDLMFLTLESHRHYMIRAIEEAGLKHLANLAYMVATLDEFPEAPPRSALKLHPYGETSPSKFAAIVEATYEDTLDCPALNGMRDIDDVLSGYKTIGQSPTSLWYVIMAENRPVGCLLLADHPDTESLELVYMGLIKSARGNGWGLAATQYAQWIARQLGRRSILLAVDEANEPALHMYSKAGFCAFERRLVFMYRPTPDESGQAAEEA
ncbi:MAG: GNAT family N-acetyltransferase [Planctomycetota bacterium]|nr:MAG: GNAT family N-acetyltransferase [Planctomycetota bacterium]